jgi:outer membrane protein insertion porin family/translocation and assembly module TamA
VSRLVRALLSAAVLATARALPAQEFDIRCDPGDTEVRRLEFVGNRTFSERELEPRIGTTQSSWMRRRFGVGRRYCLDSILVRADSLRLGFLYRQHGFREARISLALIPLGTGAVHVRYGIDEGRPTLVDSLTIVGLDSVPERNAILRSLPLRSGGRFDMLAVEATRDSIADRLRERGYPLAEVLRSYRPAAQPYGQHVEYEVIHRLGAVLQTGPGPKSYINDIAVTVTGLTEGGDSGQTHLKPDRVKSVLGISKGDLYRESSLERVKRSLFLTEAFRAVDVTVDSFSLRDDKRDSIVVNVSLVEADLHAARLSLGWGNYDCARVQGSYTNYAFLGRLRRFDATARTSKIGNGYPLDFARDLCTDEVRRDPLSDTLNYYAAVTLSQAALFGLPFVPSVTLYSERRSEFQAFIREVPIGMGASIQQGAQGGFPQTFAYQLEYGRTLAQPAFFCAVFNVCEDAARERLERQTRSATIGWVGTRNRADNISSPTSGSVVRLEARHGSRFVGSDPDVGFSRGLLDASLYRPAFDGTFVLRVRAGAVIGQRLNDARFVPLQERLYGGGATTVRGFPENELGPALYIPERIDTVAVPGEDSVAYFRATPDSTAQLVVPVGGDNLVIANAELRLRSFFLPQLVQFALFVDAGQVWTRGRSGINFDDIRVTPGVGVRYFSPIGPFRIDVGYNAYDRPAGPAYYNPLADERYATASDLRLICVSPGNTLRVRLGDPATNTPPRPIDEGNCPATYAPARRTTFLSRLTWHFSIGQAF